MAITGLYFFDKKGLLRSSHSIGEKALSVKFYPETGSFLILTLKNLYQFRTEEQLLEKVYSGTEFSSFEKYKKKIWVGSNRGIHLLSDYNFKFDLPSTNDFLFGTDEIFKVQKGGRKEALKIFDLFLKPTFIKLGLN